MKKLFLLFAGVLLLTACSNNSQQKDGNTAKVYFTKEISPEALVKIYKALGIEAEGRVAVKISTGEKDNNNYLPPTLFRDLVDAVHGTIVECNTAYGGSRSTNELHWQTIHEHGFDSIFAVDIMDEEGVMRIPIRDHKWIKYDIVGSHLDRYDFMINLAHFKGHNIGGFGGVLKNQSIGVAAAPGKAYIHSAGVTQKPVREAWRFLDNQDGFLECMAATAQGVSDYFEGKIVYISVINNLSIDCDCDAFPAPARLHDMGIMASLDPVALDRACVDMIVNHKCAGDEDNKPLIHRMDSLNATHLLDYAEKLGMGTQKYEIIDIDK